MGNFWNSANFWIGFLVTVGFAIGMVWGAVKGYHELVAHRIQRKLAEEHNANQLDELRGHYKTLDKEIKEIRRDLTPNGKNTQRLGDIAARSEEKIDNLMAFMERYAEKVDQLEQDFAQHLGYHKGADL